jgi:hypothetical protein
LAQEAAAAAEPVDMTYALPGACLVAAVRPAQILNSPAAELYPVEILQAAMIQETGLDPLTAEEVVACVTSPMQGPPTYSVAARFSKPAELKPGEMTQHTREGTLQGRAYLQSADPFLPSFFQPDPQTIVLAPDATLQQLVGNSRGGEAESLAAKFAAASQGDDFLAMIDVEPLRPLIAMGLAQAPLPPEFAQLRDIPNLVKLVRLRLNFTRPGLTELVATANNEADAKQLVFMFESYKQMFAAKAEEKIQEALASPDPVDQAAGRYMQRMSKLADEQVQLEREGNQLVLMRVDMHTDGVDRLIYIYTTGVLVALLLPAVQAAREAARRNASLNNLKQIMLAMHNYHDVNKSFPAHASYDAAGKPLLSWRVHLLPYMEEQQLYEQFHLDEPWDSEHNKALVAQMPAVYLDPSSGLTPIEGRTHYLGAEGEGLVFDGTAEGRKLKEITDGTSNTIAIIQVDDANSVTWTKPDDWEMDAQNPLANIGQLHSGVFLTGFCDGHVRAIAPTIDATMFKALLTIGGEEVVNGGF